MRTRGGIAFVAFNVERLEAADVRASDLHGTDPVQVDIWLTAPGADVKIWSGSWLQGLNFDSIAAVWARSGSDLTF